LSIAFVRARKRVSTQLQKGNLEAAAAAVARQQSIAIN
jgi:hypothetical protein